jgi:hypothetical protein
MEYGRKAMQKSLSHNSTIMFTNRCGRKFGYCLFRLLYQPSGSNRIRYSFNNTKKCQAPNILPTTRVNLSVLPIYKLDCTVIWAVTLYQSSPSISRFTQVIDHDVIAVQTASKLCFESKVFTHKLDVAACYILKLYSNSFASLTTMWTCKERMANLKWLNTDLKPSDN